MNWFFSWLDVLSAHQASFVAPVRRCAKKWCAALRHSQAPLPATVSSQKARECWFAWPLKRP